MNAPRQRLLIVGAFPPSGSHIFGGMVTSCRTLVDSSLTTRVALDLIDSTQISVPPPGRARRLVLAVRRMARYVYRLERRKPDAVLVFAAPGASLAEKGAMAWYAWLRGIPTLLFPRGGAIIDASERSRFTRAWVRLACRGGAMILCQSRRWQDFANESLRIPPSRAPIIPNWTARPELLAIGNDRRTRRGAPVRLLFVAWLDRQKGVGELLAACRALRDRRDFVLEIAGEGNMSNEARAYVVEHGLSDIVTFRGWLRDGDLDTAYARADVFVLPSWVEGLPNAMIEAMAAGLAVVVTAVGGIPDVVTDGRDAIVIPPRDVAALEAALTRAITDEALRTQLGTAASALARAHFSVEPAVDRLLSAMNDAIQSTH